MQARLICKDLYRSGDSSYITVTKGMCYYWHCTTMGVYFPIYSCHAHYIITIQCIYGSHLVFEKFMFCTCMISEYRGSPNSTNFGPPGDRSIAKIVLSGDLGLLGFQSPLFLAHFHL